MLSSEDLDSISLYVRCGFDDRDRIIEIMCEELYAPGELDPDEVALAVDEAFSRHEVEKASWPEVTDCDRLDRAFGRMGEFQIIGLQNAGVTQSDGYSDFKEALMSHPQRELIRGYCFYHGQDMERAVRGGGLCLAFGPANPKLEGSEGSAVGSIIAQILEEEGFAVDWDGSFHQRINLPDIDWKKR